MLRPLKDTLKPDPRYAAIMVETNTGWRPIELPDHHAMVTSVTLSSNAPDDVRRMFARGKVF